MPDKIAWKSLEHEKPSNWSSLLLKLDTETQSMWRGLTVERIDTVLEAVGATYLEVPSTDAKHAGFVLSRQKQVFNSLYLPVVGSVALCSERREKGIAIAVDKFVDWKTLIDHTDFKMILGCGQPAGVLEYSMTHHTFVAIYEHAALKHQRMLTTIAEPGATIIKISQTAWNKVAPTIPIRVKIGDRSEAMPLSEYMNLRISEALNTRFCIVLANGSLRHFKRYSALAAWWVYEDYLRKGSERIKLNETHMQWFLGLGHDTVHNVLDWMHENKLLVRESERGQFFTFKHKKILKHYNESTHTFA